MKQSERPHTPSENRRAKARHVVILGMHRSGTSALAAILARLGFEPGRQPLDGDPHNPRGHFEPARIVLAHDRFLRSLGRTWRDPGPLPPGCFEGPVAAEARRELAAIFEDEFGLASRWAIKDPRMCRLLPLWSEILPEDTLFVHLHRAPRSVAASLTARDRIATRRGLLLWLRHNLEAEAWTRGRTRLWLRFEELATDSGRASGAIADALEEVDRERIAGALASELDPSLIHHAVEREAAATAPEPVWISAAATALAQLANSTATSAERALDEIAAHLRDADALLSGWQEHDLFEVQAEILELVQGRLYDLERSIDEARPESARTLVTRLTRRIKDLRSRVSAPAPTDGSVETGIEHLAEAVRSWTKGGPTAVRPRVIHAFTSAAPNYLAKVRTLLASLREHCPELVLHWLVVDREPEELPRAWSELPVKRLWYPGDLGEPGWIFQHDMVELATAVKPLLMERLLADPSCDAVLYFDPDIAVFSQLDDLVSEFDAASVLITPHLLRPERGLDAIAANELTVLRYGVFNLGFLGVARDDDGLAFLAWWKERCRSFCWSDWTTGTYTDQRWLDFAPIFFPRATVLRAPHFNVAPWNLNQRHLSGNVEEGVLVDGHPLGWYHFSGFDRGAHAASIERWTPDNEAARSLHQWYERRCRSEATDASPAWSLDFYDDGVSIRRSHRQMYRFRPDVQEAFPDPFRTSPENPCFRAWLETYGRVEMPDFWDGL